MNPAGLEERHAPPARDWALAGLIALGAALVFWSTFQTRTFCDGHGLVSLHVLRGEERYQHALFLPLCDWLQAALGLGDPFVVLHLVPVAAGAFGLGAGYLVLRTVGAPRFGALLAVALLAASPALWFFATTVHTQPLLFGLVAGVALLTLLAPWQRPGLALGLVALTFPLLFLAHQSAFTLGPGWVLLVQYARTRRGARYTWPGLLLGVGPLLLAALGVGVVTSLWMRFGSLEPFGRELAKQMLIESAQDSGFAPAPSVWREEWLLPLGVLVPLALAGLARLRRSPPLALAVCVLLAFPLAFYLWWGVFENGGYFLGSDLFLLVPVAFLFGAWSRVKLALGLALLAAQGAFARHRIDAWDTGWDPAARTAQVRAAIGESGLLLTTAGLEPDIRCYLPGVEEYSLTSFVRNACKHELELLPPERVLAQMKPFLDKLLERNPRVCVELAYPRVTLDDSPITNVLAPHLRAIEAYLRERYEVRDVPDPLWPMMVLVRKR